MTNPFNIKLTEEEEARYNHLKELSLKFWPKIAEDSVMANLAEYLYIQYAKTGVLPDPPAKNEEDSEPVSVVPKIIEYRTPSDAGETLIRS